MKKDGLTLTMVFLAESANYGEGVGNITTLKKMTRGDYQQYSYISRQAIRYNYSGKYYSIINKKIITK